MEGCAPAHRRGRRLRRRPCQRAACSRSRLGKRVARCRPVRARSIRQRDRAGPRGCGRGSACAACGAAGSPARSSPWRREDRAGRVVGDRLARARRRGQVERRRVGHELLQVPAGPSRSRREGRGHQRRAGRGDVVRVEEDVVVVAHRDAERQEPPSERAVLEVERRKPDEALAARGRDGRTARRARNGATTGSARRATGTALRRRRGATGPTRLARSRRAPRAGAGSRAVGALMRRPRARRPAAVAAARRR